MFRSTQDHASPQRNYIPEEEATPPTVNNDSIFITGAIDTYKRRSAATLDLPGAFLHTFLKNETVIMILRDELWGLMVKVDPIHKIRDCGQAGKAHALCPTFKSSL